MAYPGSPFHPIPPMHALPGPGYLAQIDPQLEYPPKPKRNPHTYAKSRDFLAEFGPIGLLYVLEELVRTQKNNSSYFSEMFSRDKWLASEEMDIRIIGQDGRMRQVHGEDEPFNAVILSKLVTASCETDVMISLLKLLTNIASDFQMEYKQFLSPSTSKLSKAIDSLPDDLLAYIFELAVRMEGPRGATTARSLSHVSRRFRNVALDEKNIWTTLCSSGSQGEWNTFIPRSGTMTDFHVFVEITPSRNYEKWSAFLGRCWQTAPRWATLTLTRITESSTPNYVPPFENDFFRDEYISQQKSRRRQMMQADAEFVMKVFSGADRRIPTWCFPRLLELDIQSEDMKIALSWSSPILQILRCGGHLIPSAIFSSVSTFQYELASASACNKLLGFIGSMPNILNLQLTITFAIDKQRLNDPIYFHPSSLCPSVTSFHFMVIDHNPINEKGEKFIAAFLRALQIPKLAHFSSDLRSDGKRRNSMSIYGLESVGVPDGLSRALLPQAMNSTEPLFRPSSVQFKIRSGSAVNGPPPKMTPSVFPISLEIIPAVANLTFTTFTQIIFTRKVHAKGDTGRNLCPLREIRFKECNQITADDLLPAVQSLKDAGVWDTLERFVVENCEFVDYEMVLELVGKERLVYLRPPAESNCNGSRRHESRVTTGSELYKFIF
ncbi:hypothetical protein SCHPADRAFT_997160 [Schizopora paradoxa]|uniref:F-box domain-containing protein n=1 Tax=Schizopora paradoxa TaxID=27342 RepID=A0A0H2RPE3_9AGAM|nr:hypothetical protein SCHPADRAFT_997160 [Schizopora paradoxa]